MATLKSLLTELLIFRKHLPKGRVGQQYINEYNALLTAAQNEIDIDLNRFFIRPNDRKRDVAGSSSNYLTGESSVWYSDWYCESNFFMLRLDSAISLITAELGLDDPLAD